MINYKAFGGHIYGHVMIGGTRTFEDYEAFKAALNEHVELNKISHIVHGNCKGVDAMADRWARENNKTVIICKALWSTYGKAAGPIRNQKMITQSDSCIFFWDFNSSGTQNAIETATGHIKPHIIFRIE
jgi:hypothetical protein